MLPKWQKFPLETVLDTLIDYRGKTPVKQSFGVPLITAKIVKNGRIEEPNEFISEEDYKSWMNRGYPNIGDVIITTEAPVGEVAQLTNNYVALAQRVILLRGKTKQLDNTYLKYCLMTDFVQSQIHARGSGTTVFGIKQSELRKIEILVPPVYEQKSIAKILSSFDDKIELNRKMNATLEQIAQAIFKSWFVDFDPVKAKAAGQEPEGMDAETAALFPSEFEQSELGMIPKGWKVGSFGQMFNFTMGQSPPGETYNENREGIVFYQGRADFGFRYPTPRIYCFAPMRLAQEGETLLSVRAPVGDINMSMERCCIGRGLASIIHKSGSCSYTFYKMKYLEKELASFNGEGTVFGSISKTTLSEVKIKEPSKNLVFVFEKLVSGIDKKIKTLSQEMINLVSLRDSLLPRLISGQLRIPDVENTLGDLL